MTLANEVYTITRACPRDEVWGITSQLRRAGVSVPSNIAEGSKRSDPDFRKFLTYSLGSLAELDTQFLIAEMQGYAKYTDELKAKVVGLMAGIRAFSQRSQRPDKSRRGGGPVEGRGIGQKPQPLLKRNHRQCTATAAFGTTTRERPGCSIAQMPRCCSRALNAAKRC